MLSRFVLVAGLALVACLFAGSVQAAKEPPSADGPSIAFVQMQMVEIGKIDGVEQAFRADFFMLTTWKVDNAEAKLVPGTDDLSKAVLDANYWSPQLEFINARTEITRLVEEPFGFLDAGDLMFKPEDVVPGYALKNGELYITEDQRYQCDFTTPLGMKEFPFDTQFMQLQIESYWDDTQVKIVWAQPSSIDKLLPTTMPDIVGWTFIRSTYFDQPVFYGYNERTYHRLTIRTLLRRQPEYYLTKIVAGSMLLVYMCIWVFALAVDEADRMMGTLQIFAGLITFLFVAGGDTPKVPYQTRLDLFMLYSFFNVATILFIHGTLYYWRENDIEDWLDEQEEAEQKAEEEAKAQASQMEIEMTGPAIPTPSAQSQPQRIHVNDPAVHVAARAPGQHTNAERREAESRWYLRKTPWSEFSLAKWFSGLHFTRKVDAIAIPLMFITYSVGVAVILGRAVSSEPDINDNSVH